MLAGVSRCEAPRNAGFSSNRRACATYLGCFGLRRVAGGKSRAQIAKERDRAARQEGVRNRQGSRSGAGVWRAWSVSRCSTVLTRGGGLENLNRV